MVPKRDFAPRDVHRFVEGRVPAFMLPRLQFVPAIGRAETQKIERRQLEENGVGVIDLGDGG